MKSKFIKITGKNKLSVYLVKIIGQNVMIIMKIYV